MQRMQIAVGAGLVGGCLLLGGGAAQAQRPWRITLGYDSSKVVRGGYAASRQFSYSSSVTTSEEGALTFGLSYDFVRLAQSGVYGFVYGDIGGVFFTNLYNGVGFGVRKELSKISGGYVYVGAGVGLYGVELGNGTTLGGKAFLGLQSRGAVFVELGVPLIPDGAFRGGATLGFGFRL